jgi:hypothetical protein
MSLADHIGKNVTVWHKTGNVLENWKLIMADELGLTLSSNHHDREVFIPWCKVNYVDFIHDTETSDQRAKV